MGRSNGKGTEPEYMPGSVRVEDLGMTVEAVEQLGFRIVEHWSCAPAVSERDAHALSQRNAIIARQREDERRRLEAERERKAAEWAAKFPVLPGIPAPDPNMSAVEVMFAADAHEPRELSVYEDLLQQRFAHGKG